MWPAPRTVLSILGFVLGTVGIVVAQVPAASQIPVGARVVIAPMEGFETYFAAAVREKKVPITLTLDKKSAQYFLVSTETEWQGFVYGSAASSQWNSSGGSATRASGGSSTRGLEASIMLIDSRTKDVVWAYEVHKSSHGALILGTLAARGKQSVAEACAKHLKEFIEHSNGGRLAAQTGGASRQASASRSSVAISSTPAGAEIYLDQEFVGNTPSSLDVTAGTHSISVKKPGFQDWSREMSFQGGAITLSAELVPGSVAAPQPVRLSQRSASVVGPPGWIGVATQTGTSDGAVVTAVFPDGPGAKAGLKVGDIIQSVNGTTVKDDFETATATYKPGTNIVVGFMRGAWASVKLVTVGQSPL
jgi:PEGA domain/PDZ domain